MTLRTLILSPKAVLKYCKKGSVPLLQDRFLNDDFLEVRVWVIGS